MLIVARSMYGRVPQSSRDFGITESAPKYSIRKYHRSSMIDEYRLFNDMDRIASLNYEPTSRDLQIVRDRTPTMIELQATYIRKGVLEVILVDLQLLDVTLQFGSNVAHEFRAITAIFLLVNIAGYNEFLEHDTPKNSLLHCKYRVEEILRSPWFPQDKKCCCFFRRARRVRGQACYPPFHRLLFPWLYRRQRRRCNCRLCFGTLQKPTS